MSHFSPLTLVPLMHLIISASLKVRAVHSSFWIEKDAEQQGRLAQLGSNKSYCHNLCNSCRPCWVMLSSTCDIACAQSKHSMLPFHVFFFLSAPLWRWVLIFLSLSQVQWGSDLPCQLQRMLKIYAAAEAQTNFQTPFTHTWGPSAQVMIDTKPRQMD